MTKSDKAREIIEKYIEIALRNNTQYSKKYLATVLHAENPDMFKDVEDARSIIRLVLNANGTGNRSKGRDSLARQFALIPEQIRDTDTSEPFEVPTGIKKTLWIADVHGRFYNRKALEIGINYGIKQNCDSVIINGDWIDAYQYSKFDKNPDVAFIFEEREWSEDMLRLLQKTFGYVVLKAGNHDIRRELTIQRLAMKMPELMQMASYEDYLSFDGITTKFVKDYQHIKYGKLNAIHGHEIYGGGGIHVAHNRFNKTLDNTISAHSHKAQSLIRSDINGNVYGSWALACMCCLHPRYAPMNDWSNGFAVTEKESDGGFEVNNRIIIGDKTVNA